MRTRSLRRSALVPVVVLSALAATLPASADPPFFTSEPAMITLDASAPAELRAPADHHRR